MTIGERIRQRRKELNLTQEELAERMGYSSRTAISNVEKGGEDLTSTRIMKYASALECTPSYLMGWETNPNQKALNIYDAIDPQKADDFRREQFKHRYDTEYVIFDTNITKEDYTIIEAYHDLNDSEKQMVKRMVRYAEKFSELFGNKEKG